MKSHALILVLFICVMTLSENSYSSEPEKSSETSEESTTPVAKESEIILKVQPTLIPPVRTVNIRAIQTKVLGQTVKEKSQIQKKVSEKDNPGR